MAYYEVKSILNYLNMKFGQFLRLILRLTLRADDAEASWWKISFKTSSKKVGKAEKSSQ